MNDAARWSFGPAQGFDLFDARQIGKDISAGSFEVIDPGIRRRPVPGDSGRGHGLLFGYDSS
jgi:hypothetical protein